MTSGGVRPTRSALTLRAILAIFGLLLCTGVAVALHVAGAAVWMVVVMAVLAVVAVVDLVVIIRRKRGGEPG